MKPSKLVWWLAAAACFLMALVVAFILWPRSSDAALKNLGKVAPSPRGFAISSPGTWQTPLGTPRDWLDRGHDAVANWDVNPLDKIEFCEHLSDIRSSSNPVDQRECRRLDGIAKLWRENLLGRYPELKGAPHTLPDHKNGIRHLLDLANRASLPSFRLPDPLAQQLSNKKPWDSAAAQAWLDHRRLILDEIRSISAMPASMDADLTTEWYRKYQIHEFVRACGEAFCLDARLAAEQGDFPRALDAVKAAGNLARFLSEARNPLLSCVITGSIMLERTRNLTMESILPRIPADQLDLPAWEAALRSRVQTPADFSECMKADWTGYMLTYILPALADPAETNKPNDPEYLVEAYTRYFSDIVKTHTPLALGDLPSHPWKPMDSTGLSWRSQQISQYIGYVNFRSSWERAQLRCVLTQSAFAILKGQSPPNDPFYGQPYRWDPKTRELSLPDGFEFKSYHMKPIKLPKL